MRKYQSYKSSRVEWIGEIPEHWDFIKTNILTENLDGKRVPLNSEERGEMEGEYPYWGSNGIVDYINKFIFNEEIVLVGEDGSPFFDKLKNVSFYVNEPVWVNNHIHILKTKDRILPKYLTHSFNCVDYKEYITGSTRDKLTQSDLKRISHCVPPLSEQHQIVQFLDSKTELIDKLISTKERKITLLKEQKTSLINQVVTKGLNPNVKMKDSGVEWIGEIPVGWEFPPIKYTLISNKESIRTGPFGSSLKSDEFIDEGIRVYNQRSVYDEDFSKSDIFISEEKFEELKGFIVLPGDILITSRGTIGKMTIVPSDGEIGVLHPCLIRLRLNHELLVPKYLWWYINHSSLFINSVKIESNSTTIEVIYSETLSSVRLPIPSYQEQIQIVEFLDSKTKEIDDIVNLEQKKIDLLKEYRQSLISEVVTGKIKVTTDE